MDVGTFEIISEGLVKKKLESQMRHKDSYSYNYVRDNTEVIP